MKDILSIALASRSRGTKLLVLILMAALRNKKGYCRASVPLLSQLSGMSIQTVREAQEALCNAHELIRMEDGGGKGKGVTYRIAVSGGDHHFPILPDDYSPPLKTPWKNTKIPADYWEPPT